MSDSELFITDDQKKLNDSIETIKEVCNRNGWSVAVLALIDDGKDIVIATGAVNILPKHKEEFRHIPQLGAAMFHSIAIITAGLRGELPQEMITAMENAV